VKKSVSVFTPSSRRARSAGVEAPDPIFIVGCRAPVRRSLSRYSAATPWSKERWSCRAAADARDLAERQVRQEDFAETIGALSPAQLRELGERYIKETRPLRKASAPFFIDKMRTTAFTSGSSTSFCPTRASSTRVAIRSAAASPASSSTSPAARTLLRTRGSGRYYRDYVEFMAHFDAVLPGRVLRVSYEAMVEDTEAQVRRLLAYCNLPFEENCLKFYENERAVRTASSEQVRQPIFRAGLDHWRRYEPWLGPLKSALGVVLPAYPEVPDSF